MYLLICFQTLTFLPSLSNCYSWIFSSGASLTTEFVTIYLRKFLPLKHFRILKTSWQNSALFFLIKKVNSKRQIVSAISWLMFFGIHLYLSTVCCSCCLLNLIKEIWCVLICFNYLFSTVYLGLFLLGIWNSSPEVSSENTKYSSPKIEGDKYYLLFFLLPCSSPIFLLVLKAMFTLHRRVTERLSQGLLFTHVLERFPSSLCIKCDTICIVKLMGRFVD